MTDTQIEEHLSAYGKPEGWRWLQTKKKWVDAARRPLTLSLLPLIFDATADDSQEELRGVEEIGILERGVRRRFEHEIAREGEDMLPFNRPALRSYLGGVAFRMWSSDYYPHASLPLEGVQRELGRNAKKFIAFAIRLGFLSANEAGEYEFLHTKLRDYFAVRSFVDILLYGDETRRLEAAEALGQIGDPMAIKALAKTIQEEDPALRAESARALGRIGADEGLPHLLLALQDETDLVREKARIALQSFVRETALPNLLHALRSENPLVRSFATHALADLGRISTSGLLNALHDADSRVRWRAAVTLGQIQDPRAIPDLIASLSDSFYWVRGSAAKALGQLGDPQAVPGLVATLKDEDSSVRKAAARALGEIGTPAIDGLAGALRDKNFFVRKAAAEAMEEIGTAKARAILTQWRRD
jgi:HEAT repeat protein